MLNTKIFLAVDFGAGSLKLAEFEVDDAGALRLRQFAIKSLGADGALEARREAVILKALPEVIAERDIKAKSVNVCAPGFHVFSKFVKLPPVDPSKVTQIIQYEAQQNVPFPLAEVVWDYQILGSTPTGELEVLLVAIKADVVEGLFRVTDAAGLSLQITDVSPAALCNAFRYNYGDLEECTMLLDIGAKTSNLLFFEKSKVYARSINLGANSITQDFGNESKLPFPKAEQLKIDEGFVSLGGAYEEPENPHQAAISKIARQFMTRLHIQVNQTMQFYRGQQGGSPPQRLFLSGGASVMPYTAQFFAEKLNVPVEYFNPFRNIQIDPAVNLEELAKVAHCMGEVVGLGLRNLANCPVELNLMPESTLRWQSFNQKKPYFIATVFMLVLVVAATGWLFARLAADKLEQSSVISQEIVPKQNRDATFKKAHVVLKNATNELGQITLWLQDRYYWADVLFELRQALINTEAATKLKLGVDTGVWIEKLISSSTLSGAPDPAATRVFNPGLPGVDMGSMASGEGSARQRYMSEIFSRGRYRPGGDVPVGEVVPDPATPPSVAATPATNVISKVTLICRGVDLGQLIKDSSANATIAYALEAELKQRALFTTNSVLSSPINEDRDTMTFSFSISLELKRPLKQ